MFILKEKALYSNGLRFIITDKGDAMDIDW